MSTRYYFVDSFGRVVTSATLGEALGGALVLAGAAGSYLLGGFLWRHRGGIGRNLGLALLQAVLLAVVLLAALAGVAFVRRSILGIGYTDVPTEVMWAILGFFGLIIAVALLALVLRYFKVFFVLALLGAALYIVLDRLNLGTTLAAHGITIGGNGGLGEQGWLFLAALTALTLGLPLSLWPLRRIGCFRLLFVYMFAWMFLFAIGLLILSVLPGGSPVTAGRPDTGMSGAVIDTRPRPPAMDQLTLQVMPPSGPAGTVFQFALKNGPPGQALSYRVVDPGQGQVKYETFKLNDDGAYSPGAGEFGYRSRSTDPSGTWTVEVLVSGNHIDAREDVVKTATFAVDK